MFDILEMVYSEWWDIFHFDNFHLGADEVHMGCYNSSEIVTNYMENNGIPKTEKGEQRLMNRAIIFFAYKTCF